MHRIFSRHAAHFLALSLFLSLFLAPPSPTGAHEFTVGDLTITHPVIRLNIGARPSIGYFRVVNQGETHDRIIGARSPAFGRIELHTHEMADGVMTMRRVDAVETPAGTEVAFEHGGLHLMLHDPVEKLAPGAFVKITLEFETAGGVTVVAMTEGVAEGGHSAHNNSSD